MTARLIFFIAALPLCAQWIKYPSAGIPRNADGSPNLSAPAPKLADGTPDLRGIWRQPNGVKYTMNLAADLKPENVPLLPWAAKLYKDRVDSLQKDDPIARCNLPGVPQVNAVPYPYKIIQLPGEVIFLYEAVRTFREIFTDGRGFPEDMQPVWIGYSIGHFENGTFVVETRGQNDRTWLDSGGHPHTEQLKVIERFKRTDFGHMGLEITIDDPGAYSKPWTVNYPLVLVPDTELLEYVCTENNKDVDHLVGK